MASWNPSDKSAGITLSGSNLAASVNTNSQSYVRGDTSTTTGKIYYEHYVSTTPHQYYNVGWANSTASLSAWMGQDKNAVAYNPFNGYITLNSVNLANAGTLGSNSWFGVAVDFTNKLIWYYVSGKWNGSNTANPSTGVGGISLSTINAGPYFPVFGGATSGDAGITNFGATNFEFTVPTGFTTQSSNTQNYMATAKFVGYTILAVPQKAVSTSKFLGYALLSAPQSAISVSKMVSYAILSIVPSSPTNRRTIVDFEPEEFIPRESRELTYIPPQTASSLEPRPALPPIEDEIFINSNRRLFSTSSPVPLNRKIYGSSDEDLPIPVVRKYVSSPLPIVFQYVGPNHPVTRPGEEPEYPHPRRLPVTMTIRVRRKIQSFTIT